MVEVGAKVGVADVTNGYHPLLETTFVAAQSLSQPAAAQDSGHVSLTPLFLAHLFVAFFPTYLATCLSSNYKFPFRVGTICIHIRLTIKPQYLTQFPCTGSGTMHRECDTTVS